MNSDFQIISVDIVMDCGDTLSPAIDIGQIEGGFMQVLLLYHLIAVVNYLSGFSTKDSLFSLFSEGIEFVVNNLS